MSSPGIEPGLRPSQGRVRVRHTPRTTIGTGSLRSPPPGNRTRPCGFEGRRASATPAGKQPSALARSRTWSSTFGKSRAVRHTPRAQSKPTAGVEPASTCLQGRRLTVRPRRRQAGAQGVEPCPRVLEARCSPRSTPLKIDPARLASSSPARESRPGCPAGVEPVASSSTGSRAAVTPRTPSEAGPEPPARAVAEGAGVEPARLIARPLSRRVPSPIGWPFRIVGPSGRCRGRTCGLQRVMLALWPAVLTARLIQHPDQDSNPGLLVRTEV